MSFFVRHPRYRSCLAVSWLYTVSWSLATVGLAPGVRAQEPARYAQSPGDTLHYRQVSSTNVVVGTPAGETASSYDYDALIALTFVRPDSARAWYQSLELALKTPDGFQRPATELVLNAPFTLKFTSSGDVETLSTPGFPAEIRAVTDLTAQFMDFFITLPQEPLAIGRTWTDTLIRHNSSSERKLETIAIASYRVERDTLVNTSHAFVISANQEITWNATITDERFPDTIRSEFKGGDSGVFVFSPALGKMLGRSRRGTLTGTLTMMGQPTPMTLSQRMTYEGRISLEPSQP